MTEANRIYLEDYAPRPELVVAEHPVEKARFPCIDAHNHISGRAGGDPEAIARIVEEMDACGVNAVIDLDGNRGRPLAESVKRLKEAHPGRFYILSIMPWEEILAAGGDIGAKLAAALQQAYDAGADGLKIHKTLGLRLRDPQGKGRGPKFLMPDDVRIQPLFAKCAELKMPCLFHVADPIAFFKPLDRCNERWEELSAHPDWHFHGDEFPGFDELMECQERLLEMNPDCIFQSAHVASCSENLGYVSMLLDRYPNLHVDISARISELGRQPHAARQFFLQYADRILYGTDVTLSAAWQRVYMRFCETRDEHFPYGVGERGGQGRWRIYGIGLPDDVLEKVYSKNARRLYGEQPR